ncbi:peroxiredoxin family protein [Paenibacillus sp. GCM10012307]|uniref:TlpA family protein disulfide reductase n=1 Tax=Paenibacillus roseus TaxID=2798579 RepID=A0A934MSK2_9BACL|nr:TlpA disulfide reductase family protein [Paenibacillus roseus]MBJ6364028.1 TlpA family protein disulfide reductase [Paenibacillus roseus]
MNKRNSRVLSYGLAAVLFLAVMIIIAVPREDDSASETISFHLKSVQGESVDSESLKGQPVMLSFVYISDEWESEAAIQSKAQLNFIKSMKEQYESSGIRFLLVDASPVLTGKATSKEKLINFSYDMNIDIPLLMDTKKSNLADRYGVTQLPTTVLIDSSGKIAQRWDGLALSSQLSSAIRQVDQLHEIPAQSIFRGLDAARPLSPNLWLIDGGNDWNSEFPKPVQVLIAGIDGNFQLKVYAENVESGKQIDLYHGPIDKIPDDEAKEILTNMPSMKPIAHLITINQIHLGTGRYKLKVTADEKSDTRNRLQGEIFIDVK